MDRNWLSALYTEAGREVSLAYNVLNHTNNWGVAIPTVLLASCFAGALKATGGSLSVAYPSYILWIIVVISWIALMRFFVRSALPLANMYRWNSLIESTSKVLSLDEAHPAYGIYLRNLIKKIDAYYYQFRSPVPRAKIVWYNLKLMYLWPALLVFFLFVWGIVGLSRNAIWWIGMGIFATYTTLEAYWFLKWGRLSYCQLDLEEEPPIPELWTACSHEYGPDTAGTTLVMGFCEDGPYNPARELLSHPDISWIPWDYHVSKMDPAVVSLLHSLKSLSGFRVVFISWPVGYVGTQKVIRTGTVDYFRHENGVVRMTIKLDPLDELTIQELEIGPKQPLCFMSSY